MLLQGVLIGILVWSLMPTSPIFAATNPTDDIPSFHAKRIFAPIPYRKDTPTPPPPFQYIVIHHTAGPQKQTLEEAVRVGHTPRKARSCKKNQPGIETVYIGYHFYVDYWGNVAQAAPYTKRTNHIITPIPQDPQARANLTASCLRRRALRHRHPEVTNDNAIGVAIIGLDSRMSAKQKEALIRLVRALQIEFGIPNAHIFGHAELQRNKVDGARIAQEIRALPAPGTKSDYTIAAITGRARRPAPSPKPGSAPARTPPPTPPITITPAADTPTPPQTAIVPPPQNRTPSRPPAPLPNPSPEQPSSVQSATPPPTPATPTTPPPRTTPQTAPTPTTRNDATQDAAHFFCQQGFHAFCFDDPTVKSAKDTRIASFLRSFFTTRPAGNGGTPQTQPPHTAPSPPVHNRPSQTNTPPKPSNQHVSPLQTVIPHLPPPPHSIATDTPQITTAQRTRNHTASTTAPQPAPKNRLARARRWLLRFLSPLLPDTFLATLFKPATQYPEKQDLTCTLGIQKMSGAHLVSWEIRTNTDASSTLTHLYKSTAASFAVSSNGSKRFSLPPGLHAFVLQATTTDQKTCHKKRFILIPQPNSAPTPAITPGL